MLKAPRRVVYPVPDLKSGTEWYRRIVGHEPVFTSPMAVQFALGAAELVLVPIAEPRIGVKEGQFVAWEVDDVDAAYAAMLTAGGTPVTEPRTVMLSRQARVCDPFGNHVGLTGSLEPCRRRTLAELPSDSALAIALSRALAARDPRPTFRGLDTFADIFLAPDTVAALLEPSAVAWLRAFMARGGAYEFFLARTAWLDGLTRRALADDVPQIVLLGAGYDTRAFRFSEQNRRTRFFELDIAPTQERKRRCLAAAGVKQPSFLTFAPIDFTREALGEALERAGYDASRRTLFIWEGVTYYLPPAAVADTLASIRKLSPAGSTLAFDYMLDGPGVQDRYGVKLALESMKLHYPSEPALSRMEQSALEPLLTGHGYRLLEQLDAAAIKQRFLTAKDGTVAGEPLALFNFVHAAVT